MVPIHPLIVHFPVALLICAAFVYLFALVTRKDQYWLTGLALHAVGVAGAALAVVTGNAEERNLFPHQDLYEMVELHEKLGLWLAYGFGMMAVWSFLRRDSKIIWEKIAFCIIFISLSAALAFTAHLGGRMVYEEGAGVSKVEQLRKENVPQGPNMNGDE